MLKLILTFTFTADTVADEGAKVVPEDIDASDGKTEEEDDKAGVKLAKHGKGGVLVTESIDGEDEEKDDEGDVDDEDEGDDSDDSESDEDKSSIVSILFIFLDGSPFFNSNCSSFLPYHSFNFFLCLPSNWFCLNVFLYFFILSVSCSICFARINRFRQ
jgi:hypothetical protein